MPEYIPSNEQDARQHIADIIHTALKMRYGDAAQINNRTGVIDVLLPGGYEFIIDPETFEECGPEENEVG